MPRKRRIRTTRRGAALATSFMVMTLLAIAATSYINSATSSLQISRQLTIDTQTTHLCEAGVQSVLRNLWRPFKVSQRFTEMETLCAGASEGTPRAADADLLPGVGRYAAGVVSFVDPGDPLKRQVVVRSVGWIDRNNNGQIDDGEPRKTVDVGTEFQLSRSQVFDYTYFVNNYGWMDGFQPAWLIVNGDMRANGNFTITNGSPTVNGSVIAANNDKLIPGAAGVVNVAPVKWTDANYDTQSGSQKRWRQGYNSARHGAKGSAAYDKWRDFVYESGGEISDNRLSGAAIMDARGKRAWTRSASGSAVVETMLDASPTEEVVMPDLSDLTFYQNLSTTYTDQKATYQDGSANPNFGQGAWVKVWNTGLGAYQTITTNGVLTGSAVMVGTMARPILLHGPVTFTQDCVIKGYVEGQGTVYTGRNIHIVGSVRYKNEPDFRGPNMQSVENSNEKKDMLALAARGSVIMGNPTTFGAYPLNYMKPPFTKPRLDDLGNLVPAYDANQIDGTGRKRYQSVIADATINSVSEGVNQVDAVIYTNFVGGGNLGVGGGGVTFNGTLISKDEAMVIFSIPMQMNFDSRIRERTLSPLPLIDLQLPRSPVLLRSTWQDRGLSR